MTLSLPSVRDWLFSAKAFTASMLALYIALAFDLPRPYWAMAAVYIVANPFVGATSSKALYRALGTLLGGTAAVILVPLFVDAPELLSLVVALWTGTLLYISMLDRTPRSYVFMLAGYSLPLIGLPVVDNPGTVFDTALARSEEIILGITCASVVGALLFPSSTGTLLADRVSAWLNDAAAWADEIVRGEGALPATPLARQKLAADIAGLDLIISQLAFDAGSRDVVAQARELRGRLLMMLPMLSSLADRLHALKSLDGALSGEMSALLRDLADWLSQGASASPAKAEELRARLEALAPGHAAGWHALVLSSALARTRELVDLWQDCLSLRAAIAAGVGQRDWAPAFTARKVVGGARHYDHGLMIFQAGSAVVATFVACLIWIATGWSAGSGFVMMAAVASSFFATLDKPAAMISKMFVWGALSVMGSAVFLFAVLPMVHDFEMVVLVFAVPFLILGALIPRPANGMMIMLLIVNLSSFVALENRYSADFESFANGGLAALGGMAFAWAWALVSRPFGAELAARRLLRAGWSDLAETASGVRDQDETRLAARSLDRLGQLVPRLAGIDDRVLAQVDGFAELRVGLNVVELQKARDELGLFASRAVAAVLDGVAGHFRAQLGADTVMEPPADLCARIDRALGQVAGDETAPRALDALVGLRRALFPHATPPTGHAPPARPMLLAAE